MGKSLKYVSEFTFPSDKGYSASAGKTMVKAYARGGSCNMAEGGKATRLKDAISNERKEMARVEAKQRDAGQEMSRVRSEMRYDRNEMKGMPARKQYPVDRREPMIAMAKGGMTATKPVPSPAPKADMLYSKKEVNAKNLLSEGKAPNLPHARGSVNMAKGGMTMKKNYGSTEDIVGTGKTLAAAKADYAKKMRSINMEPKFSHGGMAKGGMSPKQQAKVGKVMGEYKAGELHSGSKDGPMVKSRKQAIAIGLSEARKAGKK